MIGGCKSCSLVLRKITKEPAYFGVPAKLLPRRQWLLKQFGES